jgi:hypothetical protein
LLTQTNIVQKIMLFSGDVFTEINFESFVPWCGERPKTQTVFATGEAGDSLID